MVGSARLWLRWSWRDLRGRWVLVTVLALIIAIGTGVYAGLGGSSAWRRMSNDASYERLRMHDLRVQLPEGGFVPAGTLREAALTTPHGGSVAATEERLVVPTQVDASTRAGPVLVPGEVVGMSSASAGAGVDSLHLAAGRALRPADAGEPVAVLESKFADERGLPTTGHLTLSGATRVSYVGTGYTPEYFSIMGRPGQFLGAKGYAVLFTPLESAQALTGQTGKVNDLVLRLAPGTDRAQVQKELTAAVAGLGGTVTNREDDPVHRALYQDAENDQTTWNLFAVLILLGAAFAAFNLVSRMIEAQRRELGVGMALGVPPRALAVRPLLVGVQIAVLGVIAGVGVGWLMGLAMRSELSALLPLPVWLTPFQVGRFTEAALLGLVIPIVATLLPIRRALRLQPVDAIRTSTTGRARGGRLLASGRLLRLPGRIYSQVPVRNVLRAPRRTLLTALGVAAAVTSMVAVLGLLDTMFATADRSDAEISRVSPDRLSVSLDSFYPASSPQVRALAQAPGVGRAEADLRLSGTVSAHGQDVDVMVDVISLDGGVWAPTVDGRPATAAKGLLLSTTAAHDLGVRAGDTVALEHPVRTATGLEMVTTRVPVGGIHPNPLRVLAYLDTSQADLFGLRGATNLLTVVPSSGTGQASLQRELFDRPAVASVEAATGFSQAIDDSLEKFTGILRLLEIVALLLVLLIAFNTASLNTDERAREHATMFAFGLPQRTVLRMAVTENALIGLLGTALGLGFGYLAVDWLVGRLATVIPDIGMTATLSTETVVTTLALGVLVVGLAPLLTVARLRRMDIPAALRVVE